MALANLVSLLCPQIKMIRIAKGTHPIRNSKDCQSGASFVNPKPINFLCLEISGFDKGSPRVMALANLVSLLCPQIKMIRIAKGTHPIRNSKDCQRGASFVNPKPINFLYTEVSGFDKGSPRVMALANLVSLLCPQIKIIRIAKGPP
jgi:hypothetical protein